jgi:hypothetical protein
MRELLIVASLFFTAAAYLLHFTPGSADFWGGNYVLELFYAGIGVSALGILLYRFDPFITSAFIGCVAGYVLIFHYQAI